MKKLALSLVAAATLFTAVPAMAQIGFYAGPGGVDVQVGPPHRYYYDYDNGYPPGGYYDYYAGPAWDAHAHVWVHKHWHP
jgi:hypothetical protein